MENIKILKTGENKYSVCMCLKDMGDYVLISNFEFQGYSMNPEFTKPYKVNKDRILDISLLESVLSDLKETCEKNKSKLESELMSTKPSDYNDMVEKDKFNLKMRIKKVAKTLSEEDIEFESDYDYVNFENNLKEICKMKKMLYSYKNDYVSEARKTNGSVKYKLRELDVEYKKQQKLLDLESINSIFG